MQHPGPQARWPVLAAVLLVVLEGAWLLVLLAPGGSPTSPSSDQVDRHPGAPLPAPPAPADEKPDERAGRSPGPGLTPEDDRPALASPGAAGEPPALQQVIDLLGECAGFPGAGEERSYFQCSGRVQELLREFSASEVYDLASHLSGEQLRQLCRMSIMEWLGAPDSKIVAASFPLERSFGVRATRLADFPEGLREYVLEAARGLHGPEHAIASLDLFQTCTDCPDEVYEVACQVLRSSTDPELASAALAQLSSVQESTIGEQELLDVTLGRLHPELQEQAMMTLANRGSASTLDAVTQLVRSRLERDVTVGAWGLLQLGTWHPERLQEHPRQVQEICLALDGAYGTLAASSRRLVIRALCSLPDPAQAARALGRLESGEPLQVHRELLHRIALLAREKRQREALQLLDTSWK